MNEYLKELLEKKNVLITRAEAVLDKAKVEKRAMTEEELAEADQIEAESKAIERSIERAEAVIANEKKETKSEEKPEGDLDEKEQKEADVRAFAAQIRGIYNGERANWTTGNNPDIIPNSIVKDIATAIRERSSLLKDAEMYTGTGTISLPYYDTSEGSINVGYVGELEAPTADAGKISTIELGGYMIKAITKLSEEIINDTDLNLVNFVVTQMADDFDFFVETELFSDSTQKIVGLANIAEAQTVETAAATVLTYNELVKAQRKVKGRFKNNARWHMSSDVLEIVETLKDGNDRPVFVNDSTAGFAGRVLGKPVVLTDAMPGFVAGKGIIIYGDPKGMAAHISSPLKIKVLDQTYADEFAIGIRGSMGLDAKVRHAQAFSKIVLKSAS